jgi:hypothetical protein
LQPPHPILVFQQGTLGVHKQRVFVVLIVIPAREVLLKMGLDVFQQAPHGEITLNEITEQRLLWR